MCLNKSAMGLNYVCYFYPARLLDTFQEAVDALMLNLEGSTGSPLVPLPRLWTASIGPRLIFGSVNPEPKTLQEDLGLAWLSVRSCTSTPRALRGILVKHAPKYATLIFGWFFKL